jgi:alanine dehydrogenase
MLVVEHDGSARPLTELISEAEIIVNGTYQDTANPFMNVDESEAACLHPGSLIIDVSCDEGMGFFFAKPTTFQTPMFKVGKVHDYAVDHTPNFHWESASRSISAAMVVYMDMALGGPDCWQTSETIWRAINIAAGVVQKSHILSFQGRSLAHPHEPLPTLPLAG